MSPRRYHASLRRADKDAANIATAVTEIDTERGRRSAPRPVRRETTDAIAPRPQKPVAR